MNKALYKGLCCAKIEKIDRGNGLTIITFHSHFDKLNWRKAYNDLGDKPKGSKYKIYYIKIH